MLIIGYTTRDHLLLDLDETSEYNAINLARMIMDDYHDVGDALVLESSTPTKTAILKFNERGIPREVWTRKSYHIVFGGTIDYERSCHIIETLVSLGVLNPEFVNIRKFRGDMTLRVSPRRTSKRTTPAPRPLCEIRNPHNGGNSKNIDVYMRLLLLCRCLNY